MAIRNTSGVQPEPEPERGQPQQPQAGQLPQRGSEWVDWEADTEPMLPAYTWGDWRKQQQQQQQQPPRTRRETMPLDPRDPRALPILPLYPDETRANWDYTAEFLRYGSRHHTAPLDERDANERLPVKRYTQPPDESEMAELPDLAEMPTARMEQRTLRVPWMRKWAADHRRDAEQLRARAADAQAKADEQRRAMRHHSAELLRLRQLRAHTQHEQAHMRWLEQTIVALSQDNARLTQRAFELLTEAANHERAAEQLDAQIADQTSHQSGEGEPR